QITSPTFPTCSLSAADLDLPGCGTCCDIQLSDYSASGVHCRLLSLHGKVFLTDASRLVRRFVNGKRVQ
ncbi:MAG: FHA domain-containing protein, partial [Planctomycetaceae bacterium]|nr:FHA domain-containing protein [Planctomycetaceae bacterium]